MEAAHTLQPDPDAELVVAAQERPSEFLALYDRYFDRVYGYVRLRIRDRSACEDITSQVFTSALARLPSFRAEGSFGSWLFRIAQNATIDFFRRRSPEPLDEEQLAALPDLDPGPEERLLESERLDRLRALLELLTPEQQHLIALRYGADLGFHEIAELVGGTEGAARVRVHRIVEDLRRRYPHDA